MSKAYDALQALEDELLFEEGYDDNPEETKAQELFLKSKQKSLPPITPLTEYSNAEESHKGSDELLAWDSLFPKSESLIKMSAYAYQTL